eukprot:1562264-Pyramimonas_sp.AAC.1
MRDPAARNPGTRPSSLCEGPEVPRRAPVGLWGHRGRRPLRGAPAGGPLSPWARQLQVGSGTTATSARSNLYI